MPETAPAQKLDDDTVAALTLFNEYVTADRAATRREREISKAEKAKDRAASTIRSIEKEGGSAEEKAEAETAYRESVAALKQVRDGIEPEDTTEVEATEDSTEADDATPGAEPEVPKAEAEAEADAPAPDDKVSEAEEAG